MRIVPVLLVLGVASAALTAPARAEGNANVVVGPRYLNDGSWDPVQDQTAWGVSLDVGKKWWPINFAIGYHQSSTTSHTENPAPVGELDLKASVQEVDFGVLKSWVLSHRLRPFVGGGGAFVQGRSTDTIAGIGSSHSSGNGAGLWLDTGVYWRLAGHLNLGIDARILLGSTVSLFGFDRSADYRQIGGLLGWGWGAPRPAAPKD